MLGIRIPIMLFFVSLGSIGLFLSYGIAYLITVIFAVLLIGKFVPIVFKIDKEFTRETSKFTFLGYLSTLFQTAPVLLMPLIILSVSSASDAALYYIAFAFGSLVLVIPDAIGMSFFVEGSQGAPVKKGIIKAFSVTLLILIPAVIILWIFGGIILRWLGKDYAGALDILRIFILSGFFVSVYQLFLYLEGIRLEVEVALVFNSIRAFVLILLSYVFLLMFGINGVAWAWMLTHAVLCIFILGYLRKHIINEIKDRSLHQ
jgi:O-antigen/teichoic acid export membrane protein